MIIKTLERSALPQDGWTVLVTGTRVTAVLRTKTDDGKSFGKLHLLPSREHQQAHGAALQAYSSCCFSISSDARLHLLFLVIFISPVRRPPLAGENLSVVWSSLFPFPLLFYPYTWRSCWCCCCSLPAVEGRLWSFSEGLNGCCLAVLALPAVSRQMSVRWVRFRFGLHWKLLLGGAAPERIWTGWSPLRSFGEGSDLFTEVTPSLFIQLQCDGSLK